MVIENKRAEKPHRTNTITTTTITCRRGSMVRVRKVTSDEKAGRGRRQTRHRETVPPPLSVHRLACIFT